MRPARHFLYRGLFFFYVFAFLFNVATVSAETVTIAGTGDSQILFCQLAQVFRQQHPEAQIMIPSSVGSSGGIKQLLAGRSELARVARPLKPKELAEGLHYRLLAYSPIIFVANLPQPCLQNISAIEVRKIFAGELTNWNQLGSCQDHKIYVANREDGDSSKSVLEQLVPGLSTLKKTVGQTIYSTPETYNTLNRYPFSFGYLPRSQIQEGALKMLDYEGVSASVENVRQGRYRLVVPLGVVWRGEPSGTTKQFLDFLATPSAQQTMLKMNTVPALPE